MDNFIAVHIFHCLTNLFHETRASTFCQHEVFVNHPLKQLSTLNTERNFFLTTLWNFSLILQFHKAIKFVAVIERIINFDDCGVVEAR